MPITCAACAIARASTFQMSNPSNLLKAPLVSVCTITQTLAGASAVAPKPPSQEPVVVPVMTTWSTVDASAVFCVVA